MERYVVGTTDDRVGSMVVDHYSGIYYLARRQELAADFLQVIKGVIQLWEDEFGYEQSQVMAVQALTLFDRLIDGFPDIGGEANCMVHLIPMAAWYVALYRPMKENGKKAEDVGKLLYEVRNDREEKNPGENAHEEEERFSYQESLEKLRKWAFSTQKRKYPADWVCTFIPGNGGDFDFGYDYTECALIKYLTAQEVPELAPYVCQIDFSDNGFLSTGFQRTKAMGYGDDICSFRYRGGRSVLQD